MTRKLFCVTVCFVSYKSRAKDGREQATIDLSSEAAAKINEFVARRGGRGMKKTALSKLVNWFAQQPDFVKSVTLDWVDEGMEHAYAAALRKLADNLDGGLAADRANEFNPPAPPALDQSAKLLVAKPQRLREKSPEETLAP